MEYIFREKLIRPGLVVQNVYPKVVLVTDPDETMARIYARHFDLVEYITQICTQYKELLKKLTELEPHLLLFTLPAEQKHSIEMVKKITRNSPTLKIVTLSEQSGEDALMKELLQLGISGHINKALTRPRDVIQLAHNVLNY